jgi:mono/diheme cytochrome c family protein
MTVRRRTRSNRFSPTHTIAPVLIATFGLAGCEASVGDGPASPFTTSPDASIGAAGAAAEPKTSTDDAGVASNNPPAKTPAAPNTPTGPTAPNTPTTPNAPQPACVSATQKAQATLTNDCSSCHGASSPAKGGFSTVLDVPALLASGKVVKNQPDMSLIYKRISAGSMPPVEVMKRPGDADIAALKDWINCGAPEWDDPNLKPAAFVNIDTRLRSVLDDVRTIPNPVDRERQRYIDFSALSNAGYSADQLQVYREAVSFLINSLSRGRTVIPPKAIDKDKLLYRIDLRDYLWDATTWTQLEELYPYSVIYDQDSRLFPFDEVSSEQIRAETNTQIPMIQADWFISHASRPPLYHTLLNLPDSLAGLEQQLGIDVQRDIDTEQVLRAGFANAGPSQNNRVIERHELGGNRGALWLSYDFSDNLGDKNIFAHPLDFQENGGELIFNLDNGLQGYFIVNAAGQRLDKAPNNVVQDPASRDGAVETGLSCMNCHQTDGQLPKYDEIRDFQLNAGANAQEIEKVLAIYVPKDELQAAFDQDQNRYRTARAALGIKGVTTTTMHALDDTHLGIINLDGVASVVGLPSAELERSIDASPQAFPPEIVTLRTKGGGIQRDSFEAIIGDLIEALGLGQQLLVRGGNNNNNNGNNNTGNNNNGDGDDRQGGDEGNNGWGNDEREDNRRGDGGDEVGPPPLFSTHP